LTDDKPILTAQTIRHHRIADFPTESLTPRGIASSAGSTECRSLMSVRSAAQLGPGGGSSAFECAGMEGPGSVVGVKRVVQVKLLPTPVQAAALEATLRACNEAAGWASGVADEKDVKRNFAPHEHTYGEVKARWGLGAQPSQHVIKKTCDTLSNQLCLPRVTDSLDGATRRRWCWWGSRG
jgi:hypothetical protein